MWSGEHGCDFKITLAAAGVVQWADISDGKGKWINNAELQRRFGITGKAATDAYNRVRQALITVDQAKLREWEDNVKAGTARYGPAVAIAQQSATVQEVEAARRAPQHLGGWEFLVQWSDGRARSWEPADTVQSRSGMKGKCEAAKEELYVPYSYGDSIRRRAVKGNIVGRTISDADMRLARGILLRCGTSTGDVQTPASWSVIWQDFLYHARTVYFGSPSVDDQGFGGGDNVREAPEQQSGGRSRTCDERQTSYPGWEVQVTIHIGLLGPKRL